LYDARRKFYLLLSAAFLFQDVNGYYGTSSLVAAKYLL